MDVCISDKSSRKTHSVRGECDKSASRPLEVPGA